MDQFWYFGGPPNPFITNLLQIGLTHILIILIAVILLLIFIIQDFRNKTPSNAGIYLLIYGLLSLTPLLGIGSKLYAQPLIRIISLILVLYIFRILIRNREFIEAYIDLDLRKRVLTFIYNQSKKLKVAIILIIGIYIISSIIYINHQIPSNPKISGVYLNHEWQKHYEMVDKYVGLTSSDAFVWSTYSNFIQGELGIFNPNADYIIHALGSKRDKYIQSFNQTKPEFVITDNSYNWGYGEWLLNSTWGFYQSVFENYELLEMDPNGAIWRLKEYQWDKNYNWINIGQANHPKITIPIDNKDEQILVIKVNYEINNPYKKVAIFGKLPRYLINPTFSLSKTPVSLPPYRNEISFPILTDGKNKPVLELKTLSLLPGADFKVTNIQYRALEVSENTKRYFFTSEKEEY